MIRAKYVFVQDDRLVAVYDKGVNPGKLHDVAAKLKTLPGVEASATRAAIDNPKASRTTVLWMRVRPMFSADKPQELFRQLTQPELVIAIARLDVQFDRCRCGKTAITVNGPTFLQEFDPEDVESFDLRLFAALQQLDVWPLVDAQPRPPYTLLGNALEKLLAELGAYATLLYIKPRYSPSLPCPHDGS